MYFHEHFTFPINLVVGKRIDWVYGVNMDARLPRDIPIEEARTCVRFMALYDSCVDPDMGEFRSELSAAQQAMVDLLQDDMFDRDRTTAIVSRVRAVIADGR